jgi:hypothetical protein
MHYCLLLFILLWLLSKEEPEQFSFPEDDPTTYDDYDDHTF